MRKALIDCRECGGGGVTNGCDCPECGGEGTTEVELKRFPDREVPVPNTEAEFDRFRDHGACIYYEGVSINDGVDQCTHPDAPGAPETCCAFEYCPLVKRREAA